MTTNLKVSTALSIRINYNCISGKSTIFTCMLGCLSLGVMVKLLLYRSPLIIDEFEASQVACKYKWLTGYSSGFACLSQCQGSVSHY